MCLDALFARISLHCVSVWGRQRSEGIECLGLELRMDLICLVGYGDQTPVLGRVALTSQLSFQLSLLILE